MRTVLFILVGFFFILAAIFVYRLSSPTGIDRPNVLLITMDTQRADRLSCYGYDKNTSPNLDNFSKEAVQFERHYAQAPMTLPAHASILTALNPYNHGARNNGKFRLTDSAVTLAEVFKEIGYRTAAIISAAI